MAKTAINGGKPAKNWWEGPVRVLDVGTTQDFSRIDIVKFNDLVKSFHANVLHYQCHDNFHNGLNEDVIYHKSRLAKNKNRDLLCEFLPLAHASGIKVVVYLNCHWFSLSFAALHPDWQVIKDDGKPYIGLYGKNDTTFCVNSPWREWCFTMIEDLCGYDIDGIFFDGPIMFFGRGCCSCQYCKTKYRTIHGADMPVYNKKNKADWKSLADFSNNSLLEFYRDASALARKAKPGIYLSANGCPLGEPDWYCGRDNRKWNEYLDVVASEGGFYYGRVANAMWKTGSTTKLLETQTAKKRGLNAVSTAFSPHRSYALTAPEVRSILVQSAIGTIPYGAFFSLASGQPGVEAIKETYGYLEENADCYLGTRSAANVALFFSSQTLAWYAGTDIPLADISGIKEQKSEAIGNFSRSFHGFYEMLVRAKTPFDVVDEGYLEKEGLGKYGMVIFPNCACLSETQCRLVGEYVRSGGNIIADFETSLYDETGARREDFGLSAVFGASFAGTVSGPKKYDFAFIHRDALPCFNNLHSGIMPATPYGLNLTLKSARTLGVFSKRLDSNIPAAIEESDDVFLAENAFGKGRCFYFAGIFGETFEGRKIDIYQRIVEELVKGHVRVPVAIENMPHLMEVILREQPGKKRLMVHFLNFEMQPIDKVIPAVEAEVGVECSFPVKQARTLRVKKNLKFVQKNNKVRFIVPRIEEFEVISLEG